MARTGRHLRVLTSELIPGRLMTSSGVIMLNMRDGRRDNAMDASPSGLTET